LIDSLWQYYRWPSYIYVFINFAIFVLLIYMSWLIDDKENDNSEPNNKAYTFCWGIFWCNIGLSCVIVWNMISLRCRYFKNPINYINVFWVGTVYLTTQYTIDNLNRSSETIHFYIMSLLVGFVNLIC